MVKLISTFAITPKRWIKKKRNLSSSFVHDGFVWTKKHSLISSQIQFILFHKIMSGGSKSQFIFHNKLKCHPSLNASQCKITVIFMQDDSSSKSGDALQRRKIHSSQFHSCILHTKWFLFLFRLQVTLFSQLSSKERKDRNFWFTIQSIIYAI